MMSNMSSYYFFMSIPWRCNRLNLDVWAAQESNITGTCAHAGVCVEVWWVHHTCLSVELQCIDVCSLNEFILQADNKMVIDWPRWIIFFLLHHQTIGLVTTSTLDLSYNNLTEVPHAPTGLIVLRLILANNNITELPRNSFNNYNDLIDINLDRNNLQIIHDGVFDHITTLERLRLRYNRIIKLPADFGPSTSVLKSMDLVDGRNDPAIFAYPYFSAFISLENLNMPPAQFGYLPNLQDSFYAPNVQRLIMYKGEIDTFPSLSALSPNIAHLDIEMHDIKLIPQGTIEKLYLLERFLLGNNQIINFPNFSHCKRLRDLRLNDNKISFIARQHIEGLESIEVFRLQHNLLTNMTDISNLSTLVEFTIGENFISEIPEKYIMGLPNMKIFVADNNFLTFLPNISKFFPLIQNLHIQGNYLKTLPDLYYQSSLTVLTAADNPYVCNQSLCWLRMLPWMKPSETMLRDNPKCDQPVVLAGTEVLRFHPTEMECYEGRLA